SGLYGIPGMVLTKSMKWSILSWVPLKGRKASHKGKNKCRGRSMLRLGEGERSRSNNRENTVELQCTIKESISPWNSSTKAWGTMGATKKGGNCLGGLSKIRGQSPKWKTIER